MAHEKAQLSHADANDREDYFTKKLSDWLVY